MKVTNLASYPIKSIAPLESEMFNVFQEGLTYDRQWVIVDENGIAITGRERPALLSISTFVKDGNLWVRFPNGESLSLMGNTNKRIEFKL
ncbi:MAG: MOSC N-terminal beta barrel domain-containing protein, partial [Bacteroidota bacterium]